MSATHVYKVWLILPSLTHLVKCDPFCSLWLIPQSAIILITVTHVYTVWLIFQICPFGKNLTHFAQCDSYFKVRQFWWVWPMFIKSDSLSKVWLIWPNVIHFSQCDSYFQVRQFWRVWPMFIKCASFSQVWPIWPNVTHFAQCDSCFKVGQFW